jgi:hypothetical protein
MSQKYRVTANMMGGAARGVRAQMVVSSGDDPYSTESRADAERIAAECRSLPDGYRDVRIEEEVTANPIGEPE